MKEHTKEDAGIDIEITDTAPQALAPESNNHQLSVGIPDEQDENPFELKDEKREGKCEAPVRVFILLCLLYAAAFVDRGNTHLTLTLSRLD